MSDLAERECVPCKGGVEPLAGDELRALHNELGNDWDVIDDHHLVKVYTFPDFRTALGFVNRVGELAEEVNHHPEITFTWGKVRIELYTHKIDGLADADFVWAARADLRYTV
jgi:4a-hydroxytetrahydrobiopterin dehydratase